MRSRIVTLAVSGGKRRSQASDHPARSARQHDLDDITADLVRDGLGELARRQGTERRRNTPDPARGTWQFEDHYGRAGVLLEDQLDPLKDRDRPLVIQGLAKADDELRRGRRHRPRRRWRGGG